MNPFPHRNSTNVSQTKKNNSLYELCLRTDYDGILASFKKLLQKYGSSSINNRNLQTLATEIYTVSKDPSTTANHD